MKENGSEQTRSSGKRGEGGDAFMRRYLHFGSRPVLLYLIIFLLMMIGSLLLFPAAEAGSRTAMVFFLALVILGNLFCLIS